MFRDTEHCNFGALEIFEFFILNLFECIHSQAKYLVSGQLTFNCSTINSPLQNRKPSIFKPRHCRKCRYRIANCINKEQLPKTHVLANVSRRYANWRPGDRVGGGGRAFVTFSFAPVEVIGRRTGVSNGRARQTVGGSANWFRHRFFAQRTGPLGDGRVCIRVRQLQKQHVNIVGWGWVAALLLPARQVWRCLTF